MAKKEQKKNNWGIVIAVLAILFILAALFSGFISLLVGDVESTSGNVAVIPITGVIMTESSGDFFDPGSTPSSIIVEDIKRVAENPNIKAILFEINSPGGAPVATDEIATAIKRANKTSVSYIREVGASGAYWIASATDQVFANRMSITGSIGVIGSYLDFSGFIQDWNVSYEQLTGGKYKDTGVPFRQLTDEERRLLQKKIDLIHQEFKDAVQKNRDLTNSEIENVGQGEFYLGSEALNLGLIDQLGGEEEAIAHLENTLNITAQLVSYEHEPSLIDILTGVINQRSFYMGKGIAEGFSSDALVLR